MTEYQLIANAPNMRQVHRPAIDAVTSSAKKKNNLNVTTTGNQFMRFLTQELAVFQ